LKSHLKQKWTQIRTQIYIDYSTISGYLFIVLNYNQNLRKRQILFIFYKKTYLPEQKTRKAAVREKFNIMKRIFKKYPNICVVDDSIVRATTNRELMEMLREAGVKYIDLRITCPPYRFPCYFGIDTPDHEKLIAARLTLPNGEPNLKAITEFVGVDSLAYQTLEGLKSCVKNPKDYCYACFSGEYPIESDKI